MINNHSNLKFCIEHFESAICDTPSLHSIFFDAAFEILAGLQLRIDIVIHHTPL